MQKGKDGNKKLAILKRLPEEGLELIALILWNPFGAGINSERIFRSIWQNVIESCKFVGPDKQPSIQSKADFLKSLVTPRTDNIKIPLKCFQSLELLSATLL